MPAPFRGKPPGSGSGEMSKRTQALRPPIMLTRAEVTAARRLRRSGLDAERIASSLGRPVEEIDKALVQMRMPRPETTRGTLNVTLAAHRAIMTERRGDEPTWRTMDRIIDELLRLREEARRSGPRARVRPPQGDGQADLPLLSETG